MRKSRRRRQDRKQRDHLRHLDKNHLLKPDLIKRKDFRNVKRFQRVAWTVEDTIQHMDKAGVRKIAKSPDLNRRIAERIERDAKVPINPHAIRQRAQATYKRKVCKDRRKRRETLFTIGKVGKGRGGPKYRKYIEDSKVRCK